MFCVIQEIERKKPITNGEYKELEVYDITFTISGVTKTKYGYQYAGDRFERPIKTAYKISIHQSYRENGKVKKRQYTVATVGYYSIADGWFCLDECNYIIDRIAEELNVESSVISDLLYDKFCPLEDRIIAEYRQTEEFITHEKHQEIIMTYQKAKSDFSKRYGLDSEVYDYCYNIFGEVMNQAYLDEMINVARQRDEYTRSYSKKSSDNYNYSSGGHDYSSYFKGLSSTYTDNEKSYLKKFYKALSMKFHPDMNAGADTTKEMQLLNKLKEDWGI